MFTENYRRLLQEHNELKKKVLLPWTQAGKTARENYKTFYIYNEFVYGRCHLTS